jgi:hypothetical protein
MVLSLTFEDPKEGQIEKPENLGDVGCENHDPHSGQAKKMHYITDELRWLGQSSINNTASSCSIPLSAWILVM